MAAFHDQSALLTGPQLEEAILNIASMGFELERVRAAMPDVDLSTPAAVFAATRALKDRRLYKAMPESELPLR